MVPVSVDYGQRVGFFSKEADNPGSELALPYCTE